MPIEIAMPQLSDTMTEGKLVKWLKQEGEAVKQGQTIAEIETDKATMEMESFDNGTLALMVAKAGQKVGVGQLIGVLAVGKETVEDVKKQYAGRGAASGAPSPAAAAAPSRTVETAAQAAPSPAAAPVAAAASGNGGRIFASPLARRIAEEKRIDLRQLRGSGPGGRIVRRDVLEFTPAASASVSSGGGSVITLTKMRQAIARSLVASKQNIPHFYETIDADVEELSQLRVQMNQLLEAEKIRLSLGDFVSKAVAATLIRHPNVNATFNGTELTQHADVHLGVAVAIPDGLIVPVLRNVHRMGLKEIRQKSVDLVDRARAQKLKQDEMRGATFTVSNLGAFGIREFSAIINPPEVAILAVGAAEKRPVVRNGAIVARTMMTLTISADHRVVDGAVAADFLRTLKQILEEPALMLLA
jgi:pyruvate dehydrogenase E2 component (dihydrolipoamide acetyltransferase)